MPHRVAIAGSLAQRPGHGGHTWVFLQYLLGFRQLGWDVYFFDWLDTSMCVDESGQPISLQESWNFRYLIAILKMFGLEDHFALWDRDRNEWIGSSRQLVLDRTRSAEFFINVMGFWTGEEILSAARRRVFLDIDPGFGQMWHQLGLHDLFGGHDVFVTIGENIGQGDCSIPTCNRAWITTPQPIVLDYWPIAAIPHAGKITSVVSWRGPFAPLEMNGKRYGLRVHEFRRFLPLPQQTRKEFELALDIHPCEAKDLALLRSHDWRLVDPRQAAGNPASYQRFIQQSQAEFLVAKEMYVRTRSGWLSDRSLCYLASGRPVLAQDTGFSQRYPVSEGLLAFSTLEEAVAGVANLTDDYERHARAARSIAEAYFDSRKVLGRLVDQIASR